MAYDKIVRSVAKIKAKCGETDPFSLCSLLGIPVCYSPMGSSRDAIKGFFIKSNRIKVITVNSDLPYMIQRIITAHELGHAMLHADSGMHAFHELALFDESSRCEKEANLFASELLISDDDFFGALDDGQAFSQAASSLNVPIELLDYKVKLIKSKGFEVKDSPISAKVNFLKDFSEAYPAETSW
ncbi:MAG: ImmA/IrrE family metallo-endopeptidase [Clostridia bacterium]|nr:ImmA/IrrE family metallo-endopeptidase [Clostridia bacterium]